MERRTSKEKLIRVFTVKRKQMEHVLMGTNCRRGAEPLKAGKSDVGSSSSSSSSSSASSKSPVAQTLRGRAEFFSSCCRIRAAEVKDSSHGEHQGRRWLLRRWRCRTSSSS